MRCSSKLLLEIEPRIILKEALIATSGKRGTRETMNHYHEIMAEVSLDDNMLAQWMAYARRYPYVGDITLQEACRTVVTIMEAINW